MNKITKISVIGAGVMGCGIAQISAEAGYDVLLISHSEESVKNGVERVKHNLNRVVEKGKLEEEQKNKCLEKIHYSWTYEEIKDADIVIETVPEKLKLKEDVFKKLEKFSNENAILATNTSSILISKIASAIHRPNRVIGLHFFNPVPVMKLVEIVMGNETSHNVLKRANDFILSLGKIPVVVKDSPGFVSNMLLMLFINEAVKILEDGVAAKEDIDTIAKLGF